MEKAWIVLIVYILSSVESCKRSNSDRDTSRKLDSGSDLETSRKLGRGNSEEYCDPVTSYRCSSNNFCISKAKKCNGYRDCKDGEDEVDCDFDKCGQAGDIGNIDDQARLSLIRRKRTIHGEDSNPNAWPWQALITRYQDTSEKVFGKNSLVGGGSIINKHWILTAALSADFSDHDWENEFVVTVGVFERPTAGAELKSTIEMYSIDKYIEHEDFDSETYVNDIALIKLGARYDSKMQKNNSDTEGLVFSYSIRPVCLPCKGTCLTEEILLHGEVNLEGKGNAERCLAEEKILLENNAKVVATGFGHLDAYIGVIIGRPHFPRVLQQVLLKIGDSQTCRKGIDAINEILQKHNHPTLSYSENSFCCVSGNPYVVTDTCNGDRGGPVVRKVMNTETGEACWIQIGIVGFGLGCGQKKFPSYYTNVARFIPWIDSKIIGNSEEYCDPETRYRCSSNNSCISKAKKCNGHRDCMGGEDEVNCDNACRSPVPIVPKAISHSFSGPGRSNGISYSNTTLPLVGYVVQYSCGESLHLVGDPPICDNDLEWTQSTIKCVDFDKCGQAGNVGNIDDQVRLSLGRAINSKDSNPNAWPWQALITKYQKSKEKVSGDYSLVGGGSIINKQWILTAAHVLHDDSNSLYKYVVSVGMFERPTDGAELNSTIEMYSIDKYIEHEDFGSETYVNDIALIKLGARYNSTMQLNNSNTEGLVFSYYTRPVCLPCKGTCLTEEIVLHGNVNLEGKGNAERCLEEEKVLLRNGAKVVATGFGHLDAYKRSSTNFNFPKLLQQVLLKIGDNQTCRQGIHDINAELQNPILSYSENHFCCVSGNPYVVTDTCQGDSGGPVVREVMSTETGESCWIQIGIVSFGLGCGQKKLPSYYTNVARFIPWIDSKIIDVDCGDAPPVLSSILNYTRTGERRIARYDCDLGFYRASGDRYLNCTESGDWRGVAPICRVVTCGDPEESIRKTKGNITDYGGLTYGNIIVFHCRENYQMLGSPSRQCMENGRWSGNLTICDKKDNQERCRHPGVPINGKIIGSDFSVNSTVRFKCYRGYVMYGPAERTCFWNKRWTGKDTPTCDLPIYPHSSSDVVSLLRNILSTLPDNQNTLGRSIKTDQSERGQEFYFMFDVSASVLKDTEQLKAEIEFAKRLVQLLDGFKGYINYGITVFASSNVTVLDISASVRKPPPTKTIIQSLTEVYTNAVSNSYEHETRSGRDTAFALRQLKERMSYMKQKPETKDNFQHVFVFTNGRHTNGEDPVKVREDIEKEFYKNITFYSITACTNCANDELIGLSSNNGENFLVIQEFDQISMYFDQVTYLKTANNTIMEETVNEFKYQVVIGPVVGVIVVILAVILAVFLLKRSKCKEIPGDRDIKLSDEDIPLAEVDTPLAEEDIPIAEEDIRLTEEDI